jgi:hypothetical protein
MTVIVVVPKAHVLGTLLPFLARHQHRFENVLHSDVVVSQDNVLSMESKLE